MLILLSLIWYSFDGLTVWLPDLLLFHGSAYMFAQMRINGGMNAFTHAYEF